MTKLFNRCARITVAKPVAFFTQEQKNAVVIRDLRVSFTIQKNLGSEPNTATVTIYNLAEQSRSFMQEKPRHIKIEAGYGDELSLLFSGDLVWARSKLDNVDWVTEIQLGDGHRARNHARVSRTFKAGVDGKTLLKELAKSMGQKIPKSLDDLKELTGQFASGVTLQGPSAKEMDRLLRPHKMSWSVQDGQLQILRAGEVKSNEAVLVSEETGMIGSPEQGAPDTKGKPSPTTVKMLINSNVSPGVMLKIKSRSINGIFRAERVTHTGDVQGGDFMTEAEAVPTKAKEL